MKNKLEKRSYQFEVRAEQSEHGKRSAEKVRVA